MDPGRFILICLAGWPNQVQQEVIEYLREEIRVLKDHVCPRRLRFTDEQRGTTIKEQALSCRACTVWKTEQREI